MTPDVAVGLGGVVLGWLLNWLPGWWTERPKLKVKVVQLLTFAAATGQDGRWRMVMPTDLDPSNVMFWVLDLIVQNQSSADDAVTEVTCHLAASQEWASTRVGRRFFGQNLRGHSLHHLHLVFDFVQVNYGATEAWARDRAVPLNILSMNGKPISLALDPAGTGIAIEVGQDMSALVAVE